MPISKFKRKKREDEKNKEAPKPPTSAYEQTLRRVIGSENISPDLEQHLQLVARYQNDLENATTSEAKREAAKELYHQLRQIEDKRPTSGWGAKMLAETKQTWDALEEEKKNEMKTDGISVPTPPLTAPLPQMMPPPPSLDLPPELKLPDEPAPPEQSGLSMLVAPPVPQPQTTVQPSPSEGPIASFAKNLRNELLPEGHPYDEQWQGYIRQSTDYIAGLPREEAAEARAALKELLTSLQHPDTDSILKKFDIDLVLSHTSPVEDVKSTIEESKLAKTQSYQQAPKATVPKTNTLPDEGIPQTPDPVPVQPSPLSQVLPVTEPTPPPPIPEPVEDNGSVPRLRTMDELNGFIEKISGFRDRAGKWAALKENLSSAMQESSSDGSRLDQVNKVLRNFYDNNSNNSMVMANFESAMEAVQELQFEVDSDDSKVQFNQAAGVVRGLEPGEESKDEPLISEPTEQELAAEDFHGKLKKVNPEKPEPIDLKALEQSELVTVYVSMTVDRKAPEENAKAKLQDGFSASLNAFESAGNTPELSTLISCTTDEALALEASQSLDETILEDQAKFYQKQLEKHKSNPDLYTEPEREHAPYVVTVAVTLPKALIKDGLIDTQEVKQVMASEQASLITMNKVTPLRVSEANRSFEAWLKNPTQDNLNIYVKAQKEANLFGDFVERIENGLTHKERKALKEALTKYPEGKELLSNLTSSSQALKNSLNKRAQDKKDHKKEQKVAPPKEKTKEVKIKPGKIKRDKKQVDQDRLKYYSETAQQAVVQPKTVSDRAFRDIYLQLEKYATQPNFSETIRTQAEEALQAVRSTISNLPEGREKQRLEQLFKVQVPNQPQPSTPMPSPPPSPETRPQPDEVKSQEGPSTAPPIPDVGPSQPTGQNVGSGLEQSWHEKVFFAMEMNDVLTPENSNIVTNNIVDLRDRENRIKPVLDSSTGSLTKELEKDIRVANGALLFLMSVDRESTLPVYNDFVQKVKEKFPQLELRQPTLATPQVTTQAPMSAPMSAPISTVQAPQTHEGDRVSVLLTSSSHCESSKMVINAIKQNLGNLTFTNSGVQNHLVNLIKLEQAALDPKNGNREQSKKEFENLYHVLTSYSKLNLQEGKEKTPLQKFEDNYNQVTVAPQQKSETKMFGSFRDKLKEKLNKNESKPKVEQKASSSNKLR